jgi:hypothetical protein
MMNVKSTVNTNNNNKEIGFIINVLSGQAMNYSEEEGSSSEMFNIGRFVEFVSDLLISNSSKNNIYNDTEAIK